MIALIKSRIQSKVKKIEKFFNSIEFSKKENDNSLITRLSSIINIIKIIKELKNNFKFVSLNRQTTNNRNNHCF